MSESILSAYVIAQGTAAAHIETIVELLVRHQDTTPPDDVNWGHVGDLGFVNAQLAEVIAFLSAGSVPDIDQYHAAR